MRLLIKNKTWCLILLAMWSVIWLTTSTTFAATTIQSNICQVSFASPTITDPQTGRETDASSIIVKGTGEPGMNVTILENGTDIGSTVVLPDGSYALEVPLAVGGNTLVAREATECTTTDSIAVAVHRSEPSQPPTPPSSAPPSSSNSPTVTFPIPSNSSPTNPAQPANPEATSFKPTITQPVKNQQFNVAHTWVSGRARPNSLVIIYVNGIEVARVIASDEGTYGAMVSLKAGKNTLSVRSELNGESATSDEIMVQYTPQTSVMKVDRAWRIHFIFLVLLLLLFLCLLWYAHHRHLKERVS